MTTISIVPDNLLINLPYLKNLSDQVAYLKVSQEDLYSKFQLLKLSDIPSKRDINRLSALIENNKPKEVELQSRELLLQLKKDIKDNKSQVDQEIAQLKDLLQHIKQLQES